MPTTQEIQNFYNQYKNDPNANNIFGSAVANYGITADQLSAAGLSMQDVTRTQPNATLSQGSLGFTPSSSNSQVRSLVTDRFGLTGYQTPAEVAANDQFGRRLEAAGQHMNPGDGRWYDAQGNVTAGEDGYGKTWYYIYDPHTGGGSYTYTPPNSGGTSTTSHAQIGGNTTTPAWADPAAKSSTSGTVAVNNQQVADLYKNVLGREASGDELNWWNKNFNGDGTFNQHDIDTFKAAAQAELNGKKGQATNTIQPNGASNYTSSPQMNPYVDQMAQSITNQVNDNWTRNLAPSLRSGAVAAGGFGGSRQGVTEANALHDINQGLSNSLSNLYGTSWQNAQQNDIQRQSLANQMAIAKMQNELGYAGVNSNYALGMANNSLGFANLDSNNAQFGANYGLNVLNSQNNWANNGVNAANQMASTPSQYQQLFSNAQNQIAGQGGTSTQSQYLQGNPALGFAGGYSMFNRT